MKTKIFTVLAAIAMTAMVSAQTFNRIVVNIEQGSESDELYLIESPSFTDDFENSYDEAKGFIGGSIYVYGTTAYGSQSMVCTNSLQGAVIGYRASAAGTATISFSDLQSDLADVTAYYLLDSETGDLTQIGTSTSYVFAAEAGDHANRFMIVEPVNVTTNAYGWASFSGNINLVVPAGLTAYKGALNGEVLDLNDVDYVKANEGVILYGTANQTYALVPGNGSSDFADNDLKPASAWASHSGTIFVLHDEALYQYTGSYMPANKAYLQISGNNAPRRISFRFDQATAIDNVAVENVKAEKVVENGQIFIRRGNEFYNLQGQLVK